MRPVNLAFGLLLLTSGHAYAAVCDVDDDGDVDRLDIAAITAARNTAASGPDDPRDADGDGRIVRGKLADGDFLALHGRVAGAHVRVQRFLHDRDGLPGRVVARRVLEGLQRQAPPGGGGQPLAIPELRHDRGVVRGITDDADEGVVLGGAADHAGPPMSICSMASSSAMPSLATVSSKG